LKLYKFAIYKILGKFIPYFKNKWMKKHEIADVLKIELDKILSQVDKSISLKFDDSYKYCHEINDNLEDRIISIEISYIFTYNINKTFILVVKYDNGNLSYGLNYFDKNSESIDMSYINSIYNTIINNEDRLLKYFK